MRRARHPPVARTIRRAILIGAAGLAVACAREPRPAPAAGSAPIAPVSARSDPEGPVSVGPPPRPERPIAVGGCGRACTTAARSASTFLEATARGDLPATLSHLDATRLVVDGVAHGIRWARMWGDLKIDARRDEMESVGHDLSRWAAGPSPARVRDALAVGPRPLDVQAASSSFRFDPPGAPPWRITLAPRGLEWLVIEIRRGPDIGGEPDGLPRQ